MVERRPAAPRELRDEVTAILRPLGVTVLLVTHDREEAFSLADRIALMRDGSIVQVGTPEELYFAPADALGRRVRRRRQRAPGRGRRRAVRTPIGAFPAPPPPRPGSRSSSGRSSSSSRLIRRAGRVVGREFRGHDVFYRVLVDGLELVSQRPSNEVVALGERVSVRLHDGRVPVLAASSIYVRSRLTSRF